MIAAYHKPMIVLLNHKDDIGKKSHLKKFTSDPNAWRNCTNEDRLSGWIDRLNRNAEKNGYREIMTVVPVFLLAAKKGMQEDNSTFLQASNYPGSIEQIRQSVNQNCMLYRSQTMLDEPSVQVHQALTALKEEEKTIRMFLDKVRNISDLTLVQLGALQRDAKQNALRSMRSGFDDFFTSYSGVPVRGILRVVSMILDLAAIWYPALTVISVPLSFISGLFKTQSQKQIEAKKQTRENFRRLVEWQKGETEKQINESTERILREDKAAVTLFLDSLTEQTDPVLHYIWTEDHDLDC